jgi:tRNA G46 methylase TrmB
MTKARTSYDPLFCERLFAVEDRHFWFQARNQAIGKQARQVVAELPPKYHVLEIGCGTRNVLRELARACQKATVIGMELFMEGLSFAGQHVHNPFLQKAT